MISIKVDTSAIKRHAAQQSIRYRQKMPGAMREVCKAAVAAIRNEIKPQSTSTGKLARSFKYDVISGPGRVLGYITTSSIYALVQDLGATIRPKTAKRLAIPMIPAARGKRARDVPGLVYTGPNSLGKVSSRAKQRGIWYALADSVRIPAKHYIARAVSLIDAVQIISKFIGLK